MLIKRPWIYSCSQHSKRTSTTLWKSLQYFSFNADFDIELNNKKGLAVRYNEALRLAKERDIDALILVHDDVWLEHDPIPKLRGVFDTYDVVGVAGTTKANIQSPALWHLMGGKENLRGAVAHTYGSQKYMTSFGPYPAQVVYLDGVFMAFNRKAIEKGNLFDEECPSKFHMYDILMGDRAREKGLTLGVGDIIITHESPGLREFTDDWRAGESYFLNKHK